MKSGTTVDITDRQYEGLMNRREPFPEGMMMEVYDTMKKPFGKINMQAIEYIAPSDSPHFHPAVAPLLPVPEVEKDVESKDVESKVSYKPFVTTKKGPGRPKSK